MPLRNSVVMATPKVPGDQKLFERVCYMLKLKVTKFQLHKKNIALLLVLVNVLQNVVQLVNLYTVIKTGLEKYCSIETSHTGDNNMWILKNSTNLLSSLSHLGVHRATSI